MPIYEYICKKCNNKFEKLVRSSDNKNPECPKCGDDKVEKVFSSFASCGSAHSGLSNHSCGG